MKRSTILVCTLALGISVATAVRSQESAPPSDVEEEAPSAPQGERAAPAPARPPERRLSPPARQVRSDMVSLNFNRADLVEVIHVLAQHLKLNYTIDPDVKGTVTIYSADPIKQEDLFPIFHQILRINGAVAVRTGDLYRIALIKDGKGLARPAVSPRDDGYALQIVPIRFLSVGEMKKLLTPFVTPGGEIIEYARGNFLVIVDLPSNIQRLMEIKDLIDVNIFAGARMELYQAQVASAEELANEMTKIMQAYAASSPQPEAFVAQFVPLPRINQLLVISYSEAAWTYAKRWLDRIDVVGEGPGRRIFIYPVENGKASDLADVLNQVLGLTAVARREPGKTLQDLHRGATPAPGLPVAPRTLPPLYGISPAPATTPPPSAGAFATVPAPPQQPAPPATTPPAPKAPQPGARPDEQLRIVPDTATNSLIIYGTAQEFQNIKNILKDLDLIPRQVLLDVLVAEVTLSDDQSLGIEYEILSKRSPNIFGQTFGSGGAIRSGTFPVIPPGALGQFGSGASGVIGSHDIKVFINALMTDSRVKILSSPTVLATDNRPARIQVGTEEPIPTGTIVSGLTETLSSSTTIQYRNTGRIVTIIPQVNSMGLVHLQIKAEVSQRGANVVVGRDSFPSFDTRDAETTAVVQDGETLVLGGIITDRQSRSRTGIPFLMDIPVLGRLFGRTADELNRTELIMLVTPRVIRNVQEARDVTQDLRERLKAAARELERSLHEGRRPAPQAPAHSAPPPEPAPPALPDRESRSPANDRISRTTSALSGGEIARAYPVKLEMSESGEQIKPAEKPPVVKKPQKAPAAAAVPNTAGRTLTAPWSIQVISFPEPEMASQLIRTLSDRGYDAYTVVADVKGHTWYRVRVGRFETLKQTESVLKSLKSQEGFGQAFAVNQ